MSHLFCRQDRALAVTSSCCSCISLGRNAVHTIRRHTGNDLVTMCETMPDTVIDALLFVTEFTRKFAHFIHWNEKKITINFYRFTQKVEVS